MSVSFVVGNWKMNTTADAFIPFVQQLQQTGCISEALSAHVNVVICPPFTTLHAASPLPEGIYLGAQDCHEQPSGAFTGNISAGMLAALGCSYTIVGHSERRQYQHETNQVIGLKAMAALGAGIIPIICIGETLQERTGNKTLEVLENQIDGILSTLNVAMLPQCILAYEPVWAIGTGLSATAEQAEVVHAFIAQKISTSTDSTIPILYGGSVTNTNAAELFAQPNISGALVGGASLKVDVFSQIIIAATKK